MRMVREVVSDDRNNREDLGLFICRDRVFGHGAGAMVFGDDAVDP